MGLKRLLVGKIREKRKKVKVILENSNYLVKMLKNKR